MHEMPEDPKFPIGFTRGWFQPFDTAWNQQCSILSKGLNKTLADFEKKRDETLPGTIADLERKRDEALAEYERKRDEALDDEAFDDWERKRDEALAENEWMPDGTIHD